MINPAEKLDHKIRIIIGALFLSIAWAMLASLILNYINNIPLNLTFQSENENNLKYSVFYYYLLAPIWEEAVFRYSPIIIAKNLGREYLLPFVVISSCFFGYFHENSLDSVFIQGGCGFIFSYVFIKNKFSYISAVIVHALYNITIDLI